MSSKRSDNGLSNILTPLNSMQHRLSCFPAPLFPCLSVFLSYSLQVISLISSWVQDLRTALADAVSDVKTMSGGLSQND